MVKNLYIFNFKPIILAGILLILAQWVCLGVSDITQDGSKQVVKQKRLWARTPGFFHKNEGVEQVLVFGNSKIGAGFYPDVFDALNDRTTVSYNLALIALQLAPHYFLLKDFIKYQGVAPDWILLQYATDGFDVESFPSYAVQGANFWEVFIYAWHRKNADIVMNYLIPSRLHWPEVSRYFTGVVLKLLPTKIQEKNRKLYVDAPNANAIYGHNRQHFYESQYEKPHYYRQQLLHNLEKERGYYFIAEQSAVGGVVSKEYLERVGAWKVGAHEETDGAVIDKINHTLKIGEEKLADNAVIHDPFVKKFFDLTKQYGIKVMIISDYTMSETGKESLRVDSEVRISPQIKYLQGIYANIYVPKQHFGSLEFGLEYFSDPGHVNKRGAIHFSELIAKEFQSLLK